MAAAMIRYGLRRSPLYLHFILKIQPFLLFGGLLALSTACSSIRGVGDNVQLSLARGHEKALQADMERIAKDTRHTYRLEYVVTDEWMPYILPALPRFRALPERQFDMSSWLRANGADTNDFGSALFDSDKRKIIIIDTGRDVALAEKLLEPMRPSHYGRVKK